MKIYSMPEIQTYLKAEKDRFKIHAGYVGSISMHAPNTNKDATESLACHLVWAGILPQLGRIVTVERFPDKDILVNGYHKLEVKATSTGDGTVSPSDSNFEAFAWIWFDMMTYLYDGNVIIPTHVITNPKSCIVSIRYVETLKQQKVSIRSVIKDAIEAGEYTYKETDLRNMKLHPQVFEKFIE